MSTIGIIGASQIGSQLARLSVRNGFDVVMSNSRGPSTLAELVKELGPKAKAATAQEAAQANNYYPERDGHIPELDDESTTTAEL